MSDILLHHYPTSPFSEKVRLVFGLKALAWRSVIVPTILPKPDVMALTGGYRRTPFMQIDSDIYCDSALMCRVIDSLHPEPPLYPAASAGLDEIVAQWADSALFWAAVPYTMQPAGIAHLFANATAEGLKAFGSDRAAMSPNLRRATLADGAVAVRAYMGRLDRLLADGRPFLLGAVPCIADFAAVQSVWFMHRAPPVAAMALAEFTRLPGWYARMRGFGHGAMRESNSAEAITLAAQGKHAPLAFSPEPGLAQGSAVTVTPTDYAHDAVAGTLVGLGPHEVVVARDDERAGTVHVHFPRLGFQIKMQIPA